MNEINFNEVLTLLWKLGLLPIIPLLVIYLKAFIQTKTDELKLKTHNEELNKYIGIATDTLQTVVTEVSQTYVDELKELNKFDKEAQLIAFNMAKDKFENIVTEDTKKAIKEVVADYDEWINSNIEAIVKDNK